MNENLLKLPNLRKFIGGQWLETKISIDEDKLDNIVVICTNNVEVNIKDYIKMIALEVIDEVLTKTREGNYDREKQDLS